MNYVFHPAAEAEFLEAVGYYESRVTGLGKTLIDEFDQLMSLLSDTRCLADSTPSRYPPGTFKALSFIDHL